MIKWIVNYWLRNKGKFVLLMIGALLISSGLSFLIGLSETSKGTTINTLEEKWKASYDIVVRPPDSVGNTEVNNLFDPNYLSGLSGGISTDQLDKIKKINGVSIAAPISILGYTETDALMGSMKFKDKGIYRLKNDFVENDGIQDYKRSFNNYFAVGVETNADSFQSANKYGLFTESQNETNLYGNFTMLLAAVDPEAEAKLVGLDKATNQNKDSRYFYKTETVQTTLHEGLGAKVTSLPILLSGFSSNNYTYNYELEKLEVPTDTPEQINSLLTKLEKNGGKEFLDTMPANSVKALSFGSEEAHKVLVDQLTTENTETYLLLNEKASPLQYNSISSPFPERWGTAYEIELPGVDKDYPYSSYRKVSVYNKDMAKLPRLDPQYIGVYSPSKLSISTDPTTEVPMETYRAPTARYVLDKNEKPVNPISKVTATSNPFGYLMQSPTMLTTIDAAKEFLGDEPISAVRIKVDGVNEISDTSQSKLEAIAAAIEKETGLITEITLGSSPQPLLIHVPSVENIPELGWIEQPWIKLGASINILKQANLGYTGIISCLIVVSIIYVFTTNLISYLSRRQEFAVLKAIGWKNSKLRSVLMLESLLIGGFVAIVTLIILLVLRSLHPEALSLLKVGLIMFFIFFIYFLGALYPTYLINNISPMQVMKQGEISATAARLGKTKGILGLVRNNIVGRWLRNSISILAIALPSALLILFVNISFQLNGVLYATWLGEYVSMEVGTPHYLSTGISLLIAVLTTAELIWQNVLERSREIALLKALGWKDSRIHSMVLIEGAFIGFISGILGSIFSIIVLYVMYGYMPLNQWWLFAPKHIDTCYSRYYKCCFSSQENSQNTAK
ncbi:ABC transporter permease [Virgibacillus halodenitrificans]|uniref:ABC transporter permease n=1 Tax=Virgibacillus halodenitrificans TaxID=1482 RepID=A0ABR7VV49_VIRHA|nr:ABC transporter permease [Virgibacillus halodenitrificans]MBD1224329.1 ABC transporter permease [Virgibacillus halodenitrificans]